MRATTRPGELAGIFKKVDLIDVMETRLCIQMGLATMVIIGFRQQASGRMPDIWKLYLRLYGYE